MATQSTLPSTNLTGPLASSRRLRFLRSSSSTPSSSIAPSSTLRMRLAPPPRNTSWLSSAVFQNRIVLSRPPAVTATSARRASIDWIES